MMAREVLRTMLWHKLKSAAIPLLLLAALATGAAYHALGAIATPRQGEPDTRTARQQPRPTVSPRPDPAPGRMFIAGRVLDPQGRPVPGASVGVHAKRKLLSAPMGSEGNFPVPLGQATADASGRFRVEVVRTSSARHSDLGAVAIAPGYGVGWAELDADKDQPSADIMLQPEQLVEGRLFNVQGQPASGVSVSVYGVWRTLPGSPRRMGPQRRELEPTEGPAFWGGRIQDRPGWPRPVTTDAEGRFTLHGLGRGVRAGLNVQDPRFAPQWFAVATDAPDGAKTIKWTLEPERTLTGRATCADTGKPVAHATVYVGSQDDQGFVRITWAETDADGRYQARPMSGRRMSVSVTPPQGQPYLAGGKALDWPAGAVAQSLDVTLNRGVWIRGKVTEEGTGAPVADALVRFNPYSIQPAIASRESGGHCMTGADGLFAMAVSPRPGCLVVQAPCEEYQLQAIGNVQLYEGKGGGLRFYAHAFVPFTPAPKPGTDATEVNIAVRRGGTVRLAVVGPDGQPARDVWVFSRVVLQQPIPTGVRTWRAGYHDVARSGRYDVHALEPDAEVPVHLLDPKARLGATVRLSARSGSGGPVAVRLEPCGQAMARLVNPQGRPVTGRVALLMATMVVTPGPPASSAEVRDGAMAADEAPLTRVNPVNHATPLVADAKGRITLPALIPGATYRLVDQTGGAPVVRKDFVAVSGQSIELGDIRVENPPAP